LAITKFPGGIKEVQSFGCFDDTISWGGQFNYTNALDKVRTLYRMQQSGQVFPLKIGSLDTRYVVISKFKFPYRTETIIPYTIELEPSPKATVLASTGGTSSITLQTVTLGGSGQGTSTAAAKPTNDTPPPQKVHIVKKGEILWAIGKKYRVDYRKIATANHIKNVNQIKVGDRLVIPS
jgi:nucleoid-associated protein YgaU